MYLGCVGCVIYIIELYVRQYVHCIVQVPIQVFFEVIIGLDSPEVLLDLPRFEGHPECHLMEHLFEA